MTMAPVSNFAPDLIIEATSVCDRACVGCYAPNVISRASVEDLLNQDPSLFLTPDKLESTLRKLHQINLHKSVVVSIRGGEPTRSPFISQLIEITSTEMPSAEIYLETHGRWVITAQDISCESDEKINQVKTRLRTLLGSL